MHLARILFSGHPFWRSARDGSIRAARNAGMVLAAMQASISPTAVPRSVRGSRLNHKSKMMIGHGAQTISGVDPAPFGCDEPGPTGYASRKHRPALPFRLSVCVYGLAERSLPPVADAANRTATVINPRIQAMGLISA